MTTATEKTMTTAQMTWNLKKGHAWPEPIEDEDAINPLEVFWTREGGYVWDANRQLFVMMI